MFKVLIELCNLSLVRGFIYVGSFLVMIVGVVYIISCQRDSLVMTNPVPIIHEHHSINQMTAPPKKVLV